LEGRSPKEKHPFLFQKEIHPPAKSEMQGVFFFRDCRRTRRRAAFSAIGAYLLGQSHLARGACEVSQGSAGNGFGLFDTMTTKFDLLKNAEGARRSRAHGRAFPQGNATAF